MENGHATGRNEQAVNSVIVPPVHIAKTAQVVNSVIGPYVTIGEGAEVRSSIVRDSIIDADASIEEAMLEHSLIGTQALVRGQLHRFNVGDSSAVDFSSQAQ